MAYLDTRFDRYRQFQIILNRPNSKQCGRAFILQMDDHNNRIKPALTFIGAGVYGAAFAVEHDDLVYNNINVVIKLADSTYTENVGEIRFGYIASKLVEDGITPNLPLYTRCKFGDNPDDIQNCKCNRPEQIETGCNFERTHANVDGNEMSFDGMPVEARIRYNERKNTKCLVSFSEKLDGSFKSFIQRRIAYNAEHHVTNPNADTRMILEVLCLLAQTIFGLKAMRETPHGSWVHRDLHPANILYKQGITQDLEKQFIQYDIDGVSHYVRHNNKLFVLWDFGKVKRITNHVNDFVNVPLHYNYDFLNTHFHLDAFDPPIDAEQISEWLTSYNYDMARLLIGIHRKLNTAVPGGMPRTKRLCITLFKYFTDRVNNRYADNSSVDPITFIQAIFNHLREQSNPPFVGPLSMIYPLQMWRFIFNLNEAGVSQVPSQNNILKRYPDVDHLFEWNFGKKKSRSKSKKSKSKKSKNKKSKSKKSKKS